MALCPICQTPGAYVGLTTIECRNPNCEHFVFVEEKVCPCCGQVGHTPEAESAGETVTEEFDVSQTDGDGCSACWRFDPLRPWKSP